MTTNGTRGHLCAAAAMVALASCSGGATGPEGPTAQGVAVQVLPASATIEPGSTMGFAAAVSGSANTGVTWSVEPAGCGSITQAGLYAAPDASATCRIRATSRADPARSGTAAVTVAAATGGGAACGANPGQLFPPGAPWNTPVDSAPLDAESSAIIGYLAANHTASARFAITYDFNILRADAATPHRAFTRTGEFYDPDCDPAPVPVPAGGRLEGESSYACTTRGDCHLTVIDVPECRLYEMWRADIAGGSATGTFSGGCLAVWNLATVPPPTGRGDFCTSADAAGLPILPLVFTADEVASGKIEHALRFILPNDRIRRLVYVRPGTHSTTATSGPPAAPPYAARLRLKASKDLSGLGAGAQVVGRALKKYGMFLADGGNVTFTAATDALTAHKWAELGMDASSLKSLSWNDFEVVELGPRIDWGSGSCERTPITE